jgi:hypothetical protein
MMIHGSIVTRELDIDENGTFFFNSVGTAPAGCSHSPDRYHPNYNAHRPAIARLLIMPPEIDLFTTLPDGKLIRQETQSEGAGLRTQDALTDVLSAHRLDVRIADAQVLQSERRIGMRALYRNVNRAIQLHAYGPQVFPQKSETVRLWSGFGCRAARHRQSGCVVARHGPAEDFTPECQDLDQCRGDRTVRQGHLVWRARQPVKRWAAISAEVLRLGKNGCSAVCGGVDMKVAVIVTACMGALLIITRIAFAFSPSAELEQHLWQRAAAAQADFERHSAMIDDRQLSTGLRWYSDATVDPCPDRSSADGRKSRSVLPSLMPSPIPMAFATSPRGCWRSFEMKTSWRWFLLMN